MFMSPALLYRERPASRAEVAPSGASPARAAASAPADSHDDAERLQHMAMVDIYRKRGGLLGGDEVALLLRAHSSQPVSLLARWIVSRRVVSYTWQSQTLVPLFQFDRSDMSLRRGTSQVVDELSDTFDDWELATWFARPNSWLQGAAPVGPIHCARLAWIPAPDIPPARGPAPA
jgi:hypothetical protein